MTKRELHNNRVNPCESDAASFTKVVGGFHVLLMH
jgi:hypothetical protein